MTNKKLAFGKKIKRATVETKPELIQKILERANNASKREINEVTAVKRYTRYINTMLDEKYAHYYSPEDSIYFENEPDARPKKQKTNKPSEMNKTDMKDIEVNLVKMKNKHFDPNLFVPIKSETAIDELISNKGGIMPATNTIVIGDPGIGKTTVMLDLLANINKNTDKKVLFVSGEMNEIDLAEYMERLPGADDVNTFFTMDYEENCHLALMKTLNMGWDIVLMDSFDEVKETLNEDLGLSGTKAEKWLIDLMVDHNLGRNDTTTHTAFLMIQQVTKGGKFVGSNKLKHNTTAMLEMRYDKASGGKPKLFYTKNRRGNTHIDMFFDITSNGIVYDTLQYSRALDFLKSDAKDEENEEEDQKQFEEMLGLKTDEDGNWVEVEKETEEEKEETEETVTQ